MKAGKKKNRSTAEKITKFPLDLSGMEDLEDVELDALLEEELKREADELEARLNSDPNLIGVGASDDLFDKIVASLKAQGVWEEDEEAVKGQEDEAGEADAEEAGKTESENREIEADYEDEKSGAEEVRLHAENMQMKRSRAEKQNEEERNKAGIDEHRTTIDESVTVSKKTETEKEETNEAEEKNTAEDVVFSDKERDGRSGSEEAYSQLSEADRRAMEYGYQMQQKDAEKKVRRKKRRKIAKRAGITAAALVAVFGVSMTSDANRRYVLEAWNTVAGSLGMKTSINYLENEPLRDPDTEEQEAQRRIKEELKIAPIEINYLPEGWSFTSYNIDKDAMCAIIFYSCDDLWFNVSMQKGSGENVSYHQLDGEEGATEYIVNEQGVKIEMSSTGSGDDESYAAMFEEGDDYYYCNGSFSHEEMSKILKYLVILRD